MAYEKLYGEFVRDAEGTLWFETGQGEDDVDRDPVHLLRYPYGERCSASEKGSCPNCSVSLMFHMWDRTFTGVLAPAVTGNAKIGSDTKPTI